MTANTSIFDLRFHSNMEVQPTSEELADFLRSSKEGRHEQYGSDLIKYQTTLDEFLAFESSPPRREQANALRDAMYYGVLGHSRFFNPALRSAVEQYKFLFHALASLDFRKPASFIKAAEAELDRLTGKSRDAAARRARLQVMISDRQEQLQRLQQRRAAIASELGDIALYIKYNLIKIVRLCENSVQLLESRSRALGSEQQLIKNSIARDLDQMRASHGLDPISPHERQTNARSVAALALKVSSLVEGDIRSLRDLYKALHRHVETRVRDIDSLVWKLINRRSRGHEEDLELYGQIEQALISLVSDYHFELKSDDARAGTGDNDIISDKRWNMIDHLFALLNQDRRIAVNRRARTDRRKSTDLRYRGRERRSGRERRLRVNRRSDYNPWL